VAIKVLPEAFASQPDRLARFEREAKALAKFSHPNILEIFDFGREGEVTYAVTEVLDGETLRERLAGGALGWRRAAEIGATIADGLAAAHQAGIVHRDLKPSNVFMTSDNRVKVLDFGLALTVAGSGSVSADAPTLTGHTDPGSVLGTVGYMSPEQVRGDPADHRSDIFSLGCVLFEMIAGTRAFAHDTAAETMTAILRDEPSGLLDLAPDGPVALRSAIRRCLEKRPGARFQSARDLAFVLRSVALEESGPVAPTPPDDKSILVLPFTNLSADPENEYFSDGLTEEIIADLAKVRSLRVISRTSAMRLKETDKDLDAISRELNVQYVLEGSVRKAGNDLRITAQLIDARQDAHLWSEKYSGRLDDVFDIQEKVSRSIVDALEVELTPQENQQIAERPIDDVRVYACYHRARGEMLKGTQDGLERALRNLKAGLDIAGDNAMLYTGMAEVYFQYLEYGFEAGDATFMAARKYADKVAELSPDSAESHFLAGRIERYGGSMLEAVRHFEKAYVANPNFSNNLLFLGQFYYFSAGRPALGEPIMSRLIDIDPLTPLFVLCYGAYQWMDGDLEQSLSTFQSVHELEPEISFIILFMVYNLAWQERYDEVYALLDRMVPQGSNDYMAAWCLFFGEVLRGNRTKALDMLTEEVKRFFWNDPEGPWFGAAAFALLDEKDEALDWLEHLVDRGFINYPLLAEQDPFIENIRGEERFKNLLERIKPLWESFEPSIALNGSFRTGRGLAPDSGNG